MERQYVYQGALLKRYRKKSGMSQSDLAKKADWNKQNISNIERGLCGISKFRLKETLDALDIPLEAYKRASMKDHAAFLNDLLEG